MTNNNNNETLDYTQFTLSNQTKFYKGKVRDVYTIGNEYLVMVASDRISAFDHILPRCIPFKGQVLNQIAVHFLESTKHIIPNWLITSPDPHVSIGKICEPIKLEMVVRGYLTGHAWRTYNSGKRVLCGVSLPEGLKENDKLPYPIITPSTKADEGHDLDISEQEILIQNIVDENTWKTLCKKSLALFQFGTDAAAKQNLILVDTKYEFGWYEGALTLMDEIHTPDSSRYFYLDKYFQNQEKRLPQEQLSKEFVRQWLIENDFQGLEGQKMPEMTDSFVNIISERYKNLYNHILDVKFAPRNYKDIQTTVEKNIIKALEKLHK